MAPREEVAYVTCTYRSTCIEQPDFLATVDLNPRSSTYGQVIHRLPVPNLKDELHCAGWGPACGCFDSGAAARRNRLVLPQPHLLPHLRGGFVVLDGDTFELKGNWEGDCEAPPSGYDFCFQPRHNVLLSSAGPVPRVALRRFCPDDFKKGIFGRRLNVWNLSCRRLTQCFDLGEDSLPLSVRSLHSPDAAEGYVGCALSGAIFRFYRACEATFIADLIISPDDRFLFVCNWLHGDIRQYELRRGCKPRLVGQVFVGGSILRGGPVTVCRDEELKGQPEPLVVKCKRVCGGPAALQLSLDGKRLYVTNSFYSAWDRQLYPSVLREGSVMLQIDVDTDKGGLCVNENFLDTAAMAEEEPGTRGGRRVPLSPGGGRGGATESSTLLQELRGNIS
ncbi:hypothetical protein DUI87_00135 [Hirundo rustica rustica]|uniref:Methanethiol oxidase n=1 Tax=Hirundo rustica rustica TaxID=333673 RepID=A0A3M0LC56_HIRRU|nr:hypothetical protein DUI87_00135 [Hirundo rustica rustica]